MKTSRVISTFLLQLTMHNVFCAPIIGKDTYSTQPNEILNIQPVQLYPKLLDHRFSDRWRILKKDNEIFYVKLLNGKRYHPKHQPHDVGNELLAGSQAASAEDIFYVKTPSNGHFSPQRLKLYRLPEYYAISIFRGQGET